MFFQRVSGQKTLPTPETAKDPNLPAVSLRTTQALTAVQTRMKGLRLSDQERLQGGTFVGQVAAARSSDPTLANMGPRLDALLADGLHRNQRAIDKGYRSKMPTGSVIDQALTRYASEAHALLQSKFPNEAGVKHVGASFTAGELPWIEVNYLSLPDPATAQALEQKLRTFANENGYPGLQIRSRELPIPGWHARR